MTTPINPSLCFFCVHRIEGMANGGLPVCEAFPYGIPDEVYFGDHRKSWEGDNGIQFEADPENRPPDYVIEYLDEQGGI